DGDVVRPARGIELDLLDAVQVHRDVGDVPGEEHSRAVSRDADVLVQVRAVEQQRVRASLALHVITAVTRVPDEGVVACAQQRHVRAAHTDHRVVATAPKERIGAGTAGDHVVTPAPVDGYTKARIRSPCSGEDVISALAGDDEVLDVRQVDHRSGDAT